MDAEALRRDFSEASTPGRLIRLPERSSLELMLEPLRPHLTRADVTELCINRPGEAFIETGSGWERLALPFAHHPWCYRLAKLIANATRQRIDEPSPLL
ncbi:MAG: hypothetical protein ACRET2_05530, partial [Steroidobacteraceae bacterium]